MKNEIKIKREVEIEVDCGYVTQYVDFECWVKNFEKGGEGLIIIKDNSEDMNHIVYCTIVCVVDGSDPEYEEKIIEKGKRVIYDYSAEFVTNDNIYYVFLIENVTRALNKAFDLQVEDEVSFNGYYEVC